MTAEAREIASILLARPIPSLKPSNVYDSSLTPRIDALSDSIPVLSALHLLNDDIDRAHTLAQSDDGNLTSNYLHAQLHRREGDYWNSKWWLGTGMQSSHPVLDKVHGNTYQAKQFVDDCQAVLDMSYRANELEARQWQELKLTLEYALDHEKEI
ncbi:uncharacterized protein BT62DRAFT_930746 [Guyanagaster necrorhizus]|uniref:Uncharacterized protein n=1 Tax=Guyanagaster necrorhizus TaxID=856835 RepID=A0A9P7VX00_9AGAR|nr:uncharacterized protein BT62DRAFT_930746 [Guyanagaster necrorhizus MCA 3950]KAG7447719.1 hypothetical protein BT62DRAFT_930746 [Guyanagaster necrorhizus MCA 3950]